MQSHGVKQGQTSRGTASTGSRLGKGQGTFRKGGQKQQKAGLETGIREQAVAQMPLGDGARNDTRKGLPEAQIQGPSRNPRQQETQLTTDEPVRQHRQEPGTRGA